MPIDEPRRQQSSAYIDGTETHGHHRAEADGIAYVEDPAVDGGDGGWLNRSADRIEDAAVGDEQRGGFHSVLLRRQQEEPALACVQRDLKPVGIGAIVYDRALLPCDPVHLYDLLERGDELHSGPRGVGEVIVIE